MVGLIEVKKYKKSYGHICNKSLDKSIEFIKFNAHKHDVNTMCSVLGIARSTYYKKLTGHESSRSKEKKILKKAILEISTDNKCRYGSPKIHFLMKQKGYEISEKRVQRYMREMNLYAITVKKYKYKSSKKVLDVLENVLNKDFTTTTINKKCVGDITYIHTLKDGWTYLASVLDLHSKKIIGYAYGTNMTNDLVMTVLERAYSSQTLNKPVISHTDLGSQYTSSDMKNLCYKLNIIQSFSKKGCPYDNAYIESFHASLKKEEVYNTIYKNFKESKLAILAYIEGWYNKKGSTQL